MFHKNLRSYKLKHLRVLSCEPDKIILPSPESATVFTAAECVLITCEWPSTEFFHTRMVLSSDPDTIVLPLGLIVTEQTGPLCPAKRKGLTFGLKFHTITVLSREPEITCLRFGLKHVVRMSSLCPLKLLLSAGSVKLTASAATLC